MKYHHLLFIASLVLPASSIVAADNSAAQVPTATEIVTRMGANDLQRQASTEGYAGMRRYVLENHHFDKRSEITVRVRADRDGTKHFEVVSEGGWKAANTHVLRKMVESEAETSRPDMRSKTKINPENYDFEITGTELVSARPTYVLEVIPKRKDKYLFRGRIWVDAQDYALVRAEGSPAKNPSFWTKSTHFVQIYYKSGAFWFPRSTQSVTEVRIFGTTDVSIEYFDYTPVTHNTVGVLMSAKVTNKP
ncbi:MAG TPA: sigma-E factor regulatory protein RseB domain-containing protein [Candidatus Acidoferrales bacterium]|nr:sigma-E factor regulatory protein RseB domain-containing protein [Candidatus Acidoferrales bacterium]